MRVALTIAGSDPSGGAGAQADLKTFHAHGVFGMAVLTALTAQDTRGVRGVFDVPPEFVAAQLEAVLDDSEVHAAKTGMVSRSPTIVAIAEVLARFPLRALVVDPVMVATSGDALLSDDAVDTLVERLFPLATLVTPNIPEAERLTGMRISTAGDMRDAAAILGRRGARAALIKGGHLDGAEVVDLLFAEGAFREFRQMRLPGPPVHGTGCALAAAITAHLARGAALTESVARAHAYVHKAIERAVATGKGARPVNLLA